MKKDVVITLLGSSGGVAKAVLSIFNKVIQDQDDPIHHVIIKYAFSFN